MVASEEPGKDLLDLSLRQATSFLRLGIGVGKALGDKLEDALLAEVLRQMLPRLRRIPGRGHKKSLTRTVTGRALVADVRRSIRRELQSIFDDLIVEISGATRAQLALTSRGMEQIFDLRLSMPRHPSVRAAARAQTYVGKTLPRWFRELEGTLLGTVVDQVEMAIFRGDDIPEITRAIASSLRISNTHARTIGRTAITGAAAAARELTWAENQDLIVGVQWLSTLDSRTSKICLDLDGNVYQVNQGPRPPAHPNCRSTTIPAMDPKLGLPRGGMRFARTPDGRRALVPIDMTAKDWFRVQPAATQNRLIGKRAAELFRSGQVPLDRLLTDRHLRPLTTEQILQNEGLAA